MKSFYLEKPMTVVEASLKSGWVKREHGIAGEGIFSGVGPYVVPLGKEDLQSDDYQILKLLQDMPILHFVAEHKRISHKEAKLRSYLLMHLMAEFLGEGFQRKGPHLFYYDSQLTISYTRTTLRSSLLYVGVFVNCEDREDNSLMGLSHFDIQVKEFALSVLRAYREDINGLDVSDKGKL